MAIGNVPPRPNRPSSKSHDDLAAVSALDAAEARLRAAMHLANEETKRADEEEKKNKELRITLTTMKAVELPPVKPTAPIGVTTEGKPISISPQAITVRGKHWKFTVPITLLASLFPLIWALVSDYTQMKRDFKTQTDSYARIVSRVEEVNTYAHEVAKSNEDLREKVAEISGFIAGVLPKAGLKVSAEPGATYVNVVSDPLPPGVKKRQTITVRTPVPAPAPKP
jgi:hypothetical protein